MAPIELNFVQGDAKSDIFHVPGERASQLADMFGEVCEEVAKQFKEYIIRVPESTGYYINETAILKKLLGLAENTNEWLFVLYSAPALYPKINNLYKLLEAAKLIEETQEKQTKK
jgi:hypothetical protein